MPSRLPLIVIGAGPVGRYAAKAARASGFAPIVVEAAEAADWAPLDGLALRGRKATAVWGDAESGIQIETDTGETVTGAAAIFSSAEAPRPVTGLGPVIDRESGETSARGVYVLKRDQGAAAQDYAAAARAVAAAAARHGLTPARAV